jgi:hypothetical protein
LLEGAGLDDIVVHTQGIDTRDEARGILGRYGYLSMVRVFGRMLGLYLRNPAYRRFVRGVRQEGVTPEHLDEYFGYGLYVGRKVEASGGAR